MEDHITDSLHMKAGFGQTLSVFFCPCRHVWRLSGQHGRAGDHRVLPGEASGAAECLRSRWDDPEGRQHHQSCAQVGPSHTECILVVHSGAIQLLCNNFIKSCKHNMNMEYKQLTNIFVFKILLRCLFTVYWPLLFAFCRKRVPDHHPC